MPPGQKQKPMWIYFAFSYGERRTLLTSNDQVPPYTHVFDVTRIFDTMHNYYLTMTDTAIDQTTFTRLQ